jgi:hypothetical protein
MKQIFLTCIILAVSSLTLVRADVGETAGRSSDTFVGTITAIEDGRDSITVESPEGTIKMFSVGSPQKEKLSAGQKVTIRYVDSYSWPLQVVSLSARQVSLDK